MIQEDIDDKETYYLSMEHEEWIDFINTLEVKYDREKAPALALKDKSSTNNKYSAREDDSDRNGSVARVPHKKKKARQGRIPRPVVPKIKIGEFVATASAARRMGRLRLSMTSNLARMDSDLINSPLTLK